MTPASISEGKATLSVNSGLKVTLTLNRRSYSRRRSMAIVLCYKGRRQQRRGGGGRRSGGKGYYEMLHTY